MAARTRTHAGASLTTKVAFLSRADVYPDDSREVEAIETHMAWVFLTHTRAWKLKKPVRYAYLDFSTLEARRHDCEEEVRLNRPLAPDVYLGTIALTERDGELALGGTGVIVDWLVVMRRLDRTRRLDRAIARHDWTRAEIDGVVASLAVIYAQARRPALAPSQYRARLAGDIDESCREILAFDVLGSAVQNASRVAAHLLSFIDTEVALLHARVAGGRVVEGHGDLRPEHVFLGPPPAIIDCIEFNSAFRELDMVDDVAFLCLECERMGAPELSRMIQDAYRRLAVDDVAPRLVAFHQAQRALLRAKIALWHLHEDGVKDPAKWIERARRYVELAAQRASRTTSG